MPMVLLRSKRCREEDIRMAVPELTPTIHVPVLVPEPPKQTRLKPDITHSRITERVFRRFDWPDTWPNKDGLYEYVED